MPKAPKVVNDYPDEVHYGYVIVTVDGQHVTMRWKSPAERWGTGCMDNHGHSWNTRWIDMEKKSFKKLQPGAFKRIGAIV